MHDLGTLSYRINHVAGPPLIAVRGFPRGEPMRPWARLYNATGDRVTLLRNWGGAGRVEARAVGARDRGSVVQEVDMEARKRSREATRVAGGEARVRAHMWALGVEAAAADERAIRAAFRAEALRCHPDKNACSGSEAYTEAEARFRRINEAHASLLAWVEAGGDLSARCG